MRRTGHKNSKERGKNFFSWYNEIKMRMNKDKYLSDRTQDLRVSSVSCQQKRRHFWSNLVVACLSPEPQDE